MYFPVVNNLRRFLLFQRKLTTRADESIKFETVFSLPTVKYISLFNRLKVYHMFGSGLAVPGAGVLEMLGVFPEYTSLSAAYIAVTGMTVLSAASYPLRNIIGFLYISEDNKHIKISSVNFWGKRVDRVVLVDEWIPLLEMKARTLDAIYLQPQLTDNTKYKLLIRFGNVLNSRKMGEILE